MTNVSTLKFNGYYWCTFKNSFNENKPQIFQMRREENHKFEFENRMYLIGDNFWFWIDQLNILKEVVSFENTND